jgi:hypothetical protein
MWKLFVPAVREADSSSEPFIKQMATSLPMPRTPVRIRFPFQVEPIEKLFEDAANYENIGFNPG